MACARLSCCATPLARTNPVGPPVALRAAQFRVPRGVPASGLCAPPAIRQRWRVASSSEGKDAPSEAMSVEEALVILDVAENASFEQIVAAKNAKISEGSVATSKVDAAYDAMLMQSMKRRLSGQVDTTVRFADVPKYKPPPKKENMMSNISLPAGLAVEQVSQDKAVTQAAAFGIFATWALIQGITDSPSVALSDVAGLQLGLSFAASIYFLREYKRLSIGRAAAITGGGLVLGALLGGLVQGWLRVDIVPVGGFGSPGVLVSEFSILGIWAFCTFLA